MHSIVTTFREAVIKVEVANFGAAIDTLIDQDVGASACTNVELPLHSYAMVCDSTQSDGSFFFSPFF